ncbi:MGMT family protein [Candidatus Woesearchaeota archaeon]|nr:MGMT family protein [Candidatus Woesearchaeota archaeon]
MITFNEKVWELAKRIPEGKVTTYRELARALNSRAYRAVGNAMHRNPYAPVVPCHRVVNSDGTLGGFASGAVKKAELLAEEGVKVKKGKIIGFERKLHRF